MVLLKKSAAGAPVEVGAGGALEVFTPAVVGGELELLDDHVGGWVLASAAVAFDVVVNAAQFAVGDWVIVQWAAGAAGQPTFAAGVGATLNRRDAKTLDIAEDTCVCAVVCTATGVFTVYGELADA